jgi:phosphoribosylamine--glycine ligase
LAAGKGVTVASTIPQAVDTLANIMEAKAFGAAGDRVVIEEHLKGKEVSTFAFTDAHTTVPMVAACDYKSVFDGGQGPNTGGMGSYSPPDFFSPSLAKTVAETIMAPVLRALHDMGTPYKSVLYSGLVLTDDGPKALEFNARFGDPEAQVILPRLKTDLFDIMFAIADHNLNEMNNIEWSEDACVGVVMASAGYPDSYKTGFPITGLNNLDKDILVFHAATKVGPGGEVVTNGGRVLTVVATGKTITEAREKVYTNISRINFEGCHYRKDIAKIDDSK